MPCHRALGRAGRGHQPFVRRKDEDLRAAPQVEALQRENKRLNEDLRKAEIIIDVQKKVSELLGNPLSPNPEGGKR